MSSKKEDPKATLDMAAGFEEPYAREIVIKGVNLPGVDVALMMPVLFQLTLLPEITKEQLMQWANTPEDVDGGDMGSLGEMLTDHLNALAGINFKIMHLLMKSLTPEQCAAVAQQMMADGIDEYRAQAFMEAETWERTELYPYETAPPERETIH